MLTPLEEVDSYGALRSWRVAAAGVSDAPPLLLQERWFGGAKGVFAADAVKEARGRTSAAALAAAGWGLKEFGRQESSEGSELVLLEWADQDPAEPVALREMAAVLAGLHRVDTG